MAIWISIALIAVGIAGGAYYFFFFKRSCNPSLPRMSVQIGRVNFSAEVAGSIIEQSCGLSGRSGLREGEAMLFPYRSGGIRNFWMKDMNFPIDMIWIGGGKVLGFSENAAPQPGASILSLKIYTSPDGTDSVLEVPAGTVAKEGIKEGDPVKVGI